ncbi:hypothetical protein PR048_000173 [Dryococelus australis]|uniref:C2H2-type domain-containing protein n=1 Tax=Dryococelus australis TaxID=614101 RepID=A0ABQ9IDX9_9NEOP|nr:hypothetical protein PR048_000173 [Dryococelus australis]
MFHYGIDYNIMFLFAGGVASIPGTYTYPMVQPMTMFGCQTCGKQYRQQCSLWRHKHYECGKVANFQCPACSYRAKHKFNMLKHMRAVHNLTG